MPPSASQMPRRAEGCRTAPRRGSATSCTPTTKRRFADRLAEVDGLALDRRAEQRVHRAVGLLDAEGALKPEQSAEGEDHPEHAGREIDRGDGGGVPREVEDGERRAARTRAPRGTPCACGTRSRGPCAPRASRAQQPGGARRVELARRRRGERHVRHPPSPARGTLTRTTRTSSRSRSSWRTNRPRRMIAACVASASPSARLCVTSSSAAPRRGARRAWR